jgi:Cation/multidrug efflux pump
VQVQLPDGVSVARTSEVVGQVEAVLKSMPQVKDTVSIIGYSFLDSFSSSNTAFMVAVLKPFEDRKQAVDSAQALIAKTFGAGLQLRTATVLPFNLPPVIGLGTTGGFEYQLESFEGADPATIGSVSWDSSTSQSRIAASPRCSPRMVQPRPRFISTSTAQKPSRWGSPSMTYLPPCRRRSAATT